MTEHAETARKIAIEAGALIPCPSCGVLHRTGVNPAEGYKVANLGFSQGLYRDVFADRRAMTDAVKDAIESALTTCACSTPAPVKPPSPAATKPAAPTGERQHPPQRTLREIALASVSQELREPLLTWASENHITTADDAFWPLAAAMANAMRAAQAAGQHARTVTDETAKIPEMLYKNVTSAGADLRAVLEAGIKAKADEAGAEIARQIQGAATTGAAALQQAAAGLDRLGADKGAAIVEQWTHALGKAAARHERARLFRASGWLTLGALILFCAGGFGMLETLASSGKIAPPGINAAWNPATVYGPNAWEVCPPGTDQTCVRPRGPVSKNPSKISWFFSKYL